MQPHPSFNYQNIIMKYYLLIRSNRVPEYVYCDTWPTQISNDIYITNVIELTCEQFMAGASEALVKEAHEKRINDFMSNTKVVSNEELADMGIDMEKVNDAIVNMQSTVENYDTVIATFIAGCIKHYVASNKLAPPAYYFTKHGIDLTCSDISAEDEQIVIEHYKNDLVGLGEFFSNYSDMNHNDAEYLKMMNLFKNVFRSWWI